MKQKSSLALVRLKQCFSRLGSRLFSSDTPARRASSSRGSTLYEIVIALALITIVSSMSVSAIESAQNYVDDYIELNSRVNDLSNVREAVTVWFDSYCSDVYMLDVEPMYGDSSPGQEVYTVVFIDPVNSARYSLRLQNGELIEKSPNGNRVLLKDTTAIQSLDFTMRDKTDLVRCTVRFTNGETSVFIIRRHT